MSTKSSPLFAYRPDIDGLRALAVLAVVAYHAFPHTLKAGFIGVDVFFVISGYLISGIILNDLRQGTFSLWNFYSRRIRRIFPALIVVLASVLIFGWFALFPDEYRALGKHVVGGAAFIANFFLWQEAGYFDVVAKSKPLLHLWSLGIEEQFYIFFPLLLWCCAKKHFRIATVIISLCAASFLYNIACIKHPVENFYSPLTRIWELLAGAALCTAMRSSLYKKVCLKLDVLANKLIYDKKQENDGRSLSLVLAVLGVILLGLALLLVRDGRTYPGWQAVLPVLGTILLIAAGSSNLISKYILANRFAVFTGLVSYPFYLWHWALISYTFILHGELDASTCLLRVGLVAASFALAMLTYFLVEKPIRFGAWARTGKVYALIIVMLMVGVAGLAVRLMDGLPDREHIKKFVEITEQLKLPEFIDKEGLAYAVIEKGTLTFCRYTDADADQTVAIIGDSHAYAAYSGIAKLGREWGYNTILMGMALPHDKVSLNQLDTISEVLKKKNDVQKVFIFTRGTVYITGDYQYNLGQFGASVGYKAFKRSLQSYVDTLREYGKEVFIVAENPELPDSTRNYIQRPFNLVKKDRFPDVHKADVIKRQAEYLQLLSEIRNATIVDTIGPMCPDGKCLVFTEKGLPMYYDKDHLSFAGSEFQVEEILKPYLNRRKGE